MVRSLRIVWALACIATLHGCHLIGSSCPDITCGPSTPPAQGEYMQFDERGETWLEIQPEHVVVEWRDDDGRLWEATFEIVSYWPWD